VIGLSSMCINIIISFLFHTFPWRKKCLVKLEIIQYSLSLFDPPTVVAFSFLLLCLLIFFTHVQIITIKKYEKVCVCVCVCVYIEVPSMSFLVHGGGNQTTLNLWKPWRLRYKENEEYGIHETHKYERII
jgi:hypothetical protein